MVYMDGLMHLVALSMRYIAKIISNVKTFLNKKHFKI